MPSRVMHPALSIAAFVSAALLPEASQAQGRIQAPAIPPPQPPGIQKPIVDPGSQGMAALSLKLDALRQSLGRQIVVLNFPPEGDNSWGEKDNNFPANNARAEALCKSALGDRYGRVVSRATQRAGDRWYFPNLLCETAP